MTVEAAAERAVTAAPLPQRFLALVIDSVLYVVIVTLLVRLTGDDLLVLTAESDAPLFLLAWAVVYEFGFLVLWSATPGKRLLGMYVSGGDGRRVRALNALLRVAAYHFFFVGYLFVADIDLNTWRWLFPALLLVSLMMALTDPQRRALHDRIAGTRVLRGPPPSASTLRG